MTILINPLSMRESQKYILRSEPQSKDTHTHTHTNTHTHTHTHMVRHQSDTFSIFVIITKF